MLESNCTKAFGMMQNADLETAEAASCGGKRWRMCGERGLVCSRRDGPCRGSDGPFPVTLAQGAR